MSHRSQEQWLQYLKGEGSEAERLEAEAHLYTCDECLERYLGCLEGSSGPAADVDDPQLFGDAVMAGLHGRDRDSGERGLRRKRPRTWLRHPLFHYAVSAAITLLLMTSGAFRELQGQSAKWQEHAAAAAAGDFGRSDSAVQPGSLSDRLTDGISHLLEKIDPTPSKEVKSNEK